MPNYVEGTLKVRGRSSDLQRFLTEACHAVSDDTGLLVFESDTILEGTSGGFIVFNDSINDIFIIDDDDAYEDVIFFNYYQACDIQAAELKKLSEAYNVDFKIFGCEMARQFARDIEIIKGKILKNDYIEYEDYFWECPFPDLGG